MEQNNTPVEHTPRRTFGLLLSKKALDTFEALSFSQTFKTASLILVSMCLTAIMVDLNNFLRLLEAIFSFYHYVILKFIVTLTVVFYHTTALKAFKRLYLIKRKVRAQLIEGVPAVEILDHLFTLGTFKREEVKKKFGIPHDRFEKLAKRLESLGVLYKDKAANNARALNPVYSRQDVAAILEGKKTSEELNQPLKQVTGRAWTVEPLGPTIKERVADMLSSSPPVFTLRRIRQ